MIEAMSERDDSPRLMTIPASDAAFRARIEAIREGEGLTTPVALQTRLRRLLPKVSVTARGLAGEPTTWYVYRDGRWPSAATQTWWVDETGSTATIGFDGTVNAATPPALELLGLNGKDLGTINVRSLFDPEAIADVEALFQIIASGRDLTATLRIRRPDGQARTVDIHAARSEDGVAVTLRPTTEG
jgi:PAS domain-containing protein